MARSPRRASAAPLLVLLLVALGGLGLRLWGTDFGLPHSKEKDWEVVAAVKRFRGDELKTVQDRENFAGYPLLLAALTHVATRREVPSPGAELSIEDHRRIAADDHLDTRRTSAWVSTLIVPATWLLARWFVGPWWSVYAAALAATSLLHVFFSQQSRPHGPLGACMVLAVVAALRMRREPTTLRYLVLGLALFAAVGFLHSGIALLLPLCVAHLLRASPGPLGTRARLLGPRLLIPLALTGASIGAFYWPVFDPTLSGDVGGTTLTMPAGHVIDFRRFNGTGLDTTLRTLWGYEPTTVVLAAVGALGLVLNRLLGRRSGASAERGDLAVVLSFVVPYFAAISLWEENYERFVIPLVPFLACLAAWGASQCVGRVRPGALRAAATLAFAACLGLPAYASGRLALLRSRPDTMEQAAAWVEENISHETDKIWVTPWWDLPLVRNPEALMHKEGKKAFHDQSIWKRYQADLGSAALPPPRWPVYTILMAKGFEQNSVEGLRAYFDYLGPGCYVIDAKKRGHPWMKWFSSELEQRGTLLARISPDADEWAWNYPLWEQDGVEPDFPAVFPRVLRAVAVGPVIEIYRVE